jgi:hypothetical protein
MSDRGVLEKADDERWFQGFATAVWILARWNIGPKGIMREGGVSIDDLRAAGVDETMIKKIEEAKQ